MNQPAAQLFRTLKFKVAPIDSSEKRERVRDISLFVWRRLVDSVDFDTIGCRRLSALAHNGFSKGVVLWEFTLSRFKHSLWDVGDVHLAGGLVNHVVTAARVVCQGGRHGRG
ncbi:hypothetical protein RRG08_046228 [Elysia crispata]|uniref:Uncharacterized protein n=1 Tax=Elysia crispata TaxID=231223 RepID=A0AAE1D1J4_9GAST|nr:hypothetical protein RRG08_046228 [Elysia crispata]